MKTLFTIFFFCSLSSAQQKTEYTISFENALHHEAEVTAVFSGIKTPVLEVRMSRTSPGRYALHEFGKNVYRLAAFDENNRPLTITRPTAYQWNVAGHRGTVRLRYTIYGDHLDGTYLAIDNTHAHLNMPAVFMWARGFEKSPVSARFIIPPSSGWRVATQLKPDADSAIFSAPNLHYFMDSPTEISSFSLRTWKSSGSSFALAIHQNDSPQFVDAYAKIAEAIVREAEGIWGSFAPYDNGGYTFLSDYLPFANGDGMEHRNSTVLTSSGTLKKNGVGVAGTVAHEFFHSWNVERIRPKTLEPFSFEEANMSGELWFAEGFTSYYGGLIMKRAGLVSLENFAKGISGTVDAVVNTNAWKYFSPVDLSRQAVFVDAAVAVDQNNRANTFLSYYTAGGGIALGLDLTLRSQCNRTLDDFMRAVWKQHPDVHKPYTISDLEKILGEVTNNPSFARKFFEEYITGYRLPDYEQLLTNAGLKIKKAHPGKATWGDVQLREENGNVIIQGATIIGSPAYAAGLDRGARIIRIDTMAITRRTDADSLFALHKPGDTVMIKFDLRGEKKMSDLVLEESRHIEVVPFEQDSLPVTEAVKKFRESWLGSHAKEKLPALYKYCPKCRKQWEFIKEKCGEDAEVLTIALE